MKHVFKWADLNSENEDSTENWHDMFKGDTGFKFKDEGSLFKEITMTTDLLKQINEIAEYAKEQTVNAPDKRYYSKLVFMKNLLLLYASSSLTLSIGYNKGMSIWPHTPIF